MNLLMSTRGPIGSKLDNSNDLVLASTRDNAQLMETQERTTSPMTTRNVVSAGINGFTHQINHGGSKTPS